MCFSFQIIVANPKTAGVARWIFLALWGSKMKKGDAAAAEYVTKVCAVDDSDLRCLPCAPAANTIGDVVHCFNETA